MPSLLHSLFRKIIYFFPLLLTLLSSSSRAQAPIFSGVNFTGLDGESVHVVRSVAGGYLNYFNTAIAPSSLVQQGQVHVSFMPRVGGELVSIQAKNLASCFAFVEPGTNVVLRQIGTNPANTAALVFEGPNAAGNNLLLAGLLLNRPAGLDQEVVRKAMATGVTAPVILHQLRGVLHACTARLDSVRRRKLISVACYNSLRAQTEQSLLFWTGYLVSAYEVAENRTRLDFHASETEIRQVLKTLMVEFDPYAPRYQGQFATVATAHAKYRFQAKGLLPSTSNTLRYWNRYATQFKDVNEAFGEVDYAPATEQSLLIGDELLTALALRPMSDTDFAVVLQDYMQHFPTSPYIPVITQVLLQQAAVAPPTTGSGNQNLGHYDETSGQLTFNLATNLDTVTTLAGLIQRQFPGRPVFVDFWASWCSPCIAEFRQEPELYTFLKQHGIEPLYVSVNNVNYHTKWQEFVSNNKLRGSHYLASVLMQKSLASLLARGIPRYVLFDAQGNLVDNDLPLPSTGELFRHRVLNKLGAK